MVRVGFPLEQKKNHNIWHNNKKKKKLFIFQFRFSFSNSVFFTHLNSISFRFFSHVYFVIVEKYLTFICLKHSAVSTPKNARMQKFFIFIAVFCFLLFDFKIVSHKKQQQGGRGSEQH